MLIRFFKAFFAALFSIITNQQTIIAGQTQILAEQAKLEEDINNLEDNMTTQFDALTAQVAQTKTVMESAVTLLKGISDQAQALADAEAEIGNDNSLAQQFADNLAAKTSELAAAVATFTPATPPPSDG